MRYLLLLMVIFTTACNLKTDEKINAKVVNETIRKRKIKRVLEDDIVGTAYTMGKLAADTARLLLPKNAEDMCSTFNFTDQ